MDDWIRRFRGSNKEELRSGRQGNGLVRRGVVSVLRERSNLRNGFTEEETGETDLLVDGELREVGESGAK